MIVTTSFYDMNQKLQVLNKHKNKNKKTKKKKKLTPTSQISVDPIYIILQVIMIMCVGSLNYCVEDGIQCNFSNIFF